MVEALVMPLHVHTTHVKVKEEKILDLSSDPFIMVCHGDG